MCFYGGAFRQCLRASDDGRMSGDFLPKLEWYDVVRRLFVSFDRDSLSEELRGKEFWPDVAEYEYRAFEEGLAKS